jgi:hypothetical protein
MLTVQKHANTTRIIAFSGKGPIQRKHSFLALIRKFFFANLIGCCVSEVSEDIKKQNQLKLSQTIILQFGSFLFNACCASAVPASE